MTPAERTTLAREVMHRTRTEQGLSPTLTDPGQLERLAILIDDALPREQSA